MSTLLFVSLLILISGMYADDETCGKTKPTTLRLRETILCDYDKTTRPAIVHDNLTSVIVHLKIRYFDYDAHSSTMSVDAWLPMLWEDEHLKWIPQDYDMITELHISSDDIWTPDISLYNKGDLSIGPRLYETADCMIHYNGKVVCLPIAEMEGLCVPDVKYWPYDTQICKLKIGSWIHRGDEIDFETTNNSIITKGYTPNSEWLLINATVSKDPGKFLGFNSTYPSLAYTFEIKRHSAAAAATVVVPALVMMIMTVLILWLDPKSSDRIYLIALNLPCHFLFLQHVTWEVPLNGDSVAYIILFLRDSMLMAAFSLLETVIVRSMMNTKRESPVWLVTLSTNLLNSKIGQLLLFSELDPKEAALNVSEDDSTNLVEVSNGSRQKEWFMFGKVLDRICFNLYVLSYLIMVILYLPK